MSFGGGLPFAAEPPVVELAFLIIFVFIATDFCDTAVWFQAEETASSLRIIHIHEHVVSAFLAEGDFHFLAHGQRVSHVTLKHQQV